MAFPPLLGGLMGKDKGLMGREEGGMTGVSRQEAGRWLPGAHQTNLKIPLEGVKFVYQTIFKQFLNSPT